MALNLLHSNDRPGTYPDSWYAATANALDPFEPLTGDVTADVCVVGGGYTGLSAALHLAEAGRKVVLVEAHRVGFGASGRNGGQLGSGQRKDQEALEKLVGRDDAAKLWQLGEDSKDLVKGLIDRHNIDCDLKPGVAWTGSSAVMSAICTTTRPSCRTATAMISLKCWMIRPATPCAPLPITRAGFWITARRICTR
jgi:gamma-glutamylputrescine oxidase